MTGLLPTTLPSFSSRQSGYGCALMSPHPGLADLIRRGRGSYHAVRLSHSCCRTSGLHELTTCSPFLGFSTRLLAITRGDQFFLKLRPFISRHGRLPILRG